LDDGSKSLEESLEMLAVAREAGTTDIVATPHADLQYAFQPSLIADRLSELRSKHGTQIPRLYTGCDFHLQFDNIQDAIANPRKYTINQKSYLLVEFSDLVIFPNTTGIFASLLRAGMTPIVTHPERNPLLQQRIGQLQEWVEMGCRLQVTAQSLDGRFGKRAASFSRELLQRNLAHFVASDAHDAKHRPPRLDEAYRWIERRYGSVWAANLVVENPRAVLTGDPVDWDPTVRPTSRKWFQLW
jgi:protein-tyrosine phosphatase